MTLKVKMTKLCHKTLPEQLILNASVTVRKFLSVDHILQSEIVSV